MPRIPDYQQQVQSDTGPQIQVQSGAPIEAFGGGQALQGMETAGKLADQSAQMFTDIKKQADVAKVLQANDLTTQAKNQGLYDPKSGAMNLKGQAAFGASESYGAKFRATTDEIAANLDNDDQRAMYQKVRAQAAEEFQSTLEKHTFTQSQAFQKEQYDSSLKTIQDDTTLNYFVPGKVGANVERAKALALQQATADGVLDPDMRQQRVRDVESKVYVGVLERMMNTSDPKASGYYLAVQGNMTAEDRDRVDKTLKATSLEAESSRKADEIAAKFPDVTSQLQEARTLEPGELRTKIIQHIKDTNADTQAARDADNKNRFSTLSQIVEQSGGYGRLPMTELMKLDSDDRAKLEARSRQLKEGVTAEKASRQYYKLMGLASDEPGKFKNMNLDTIRGTVTAEELTKFIGMQDDLRAGKGVKALDQHRSAQAIADDGARALGLKGRIFDSEKIKDYNDEFYRRLDRAAEDKGKPLNDEEMTRIRDDMATKLLVKGWLWNSKSPSFEIEATEDGKSSPDISRIQDVPKQTLRQIREAMARNGVRYSDDKALSYANRAMRNTRGK